MSSPLPVKAAYAALREYCQEGGSSPTLVQLHKEGATPYQILASTLLSLRTKDHITMTAAKRLLEKAPTPEATARLTEEDIAEFIFPVGFYKTKAAQLKEIAGILISKFNGQVPQSQDDLMSLPGVGQKTANLVLSLAFGIDAICVDTHVHRIVNRFGWVKTVTPEETERALKKFLPREYWIETNELLVTFGQEVCTPAAPRCSDCMFLSFCPKIGIVSAR